MNESIFGINYRVITHFLACLDIAELSKMIVVSTFWVDFSLYRNKLNDIFTATFIKPMN